MSGHAELIQEEKKKISVANLRVQEPGKSKNKTWVKQLHSNRRTDIELAAEAERAIEWLTTVPQEAIQITARNGWLHLEGALSCRHQLTTVQEVTRHLPGVRGIIESIAIKPTI